MIEKSIYGTMEQVKKVIDLLDNCSLNGDYVYLQLLEGEDIDHNRYRLTYSVPLLNKENSFSLLYAIAACFRRDFTVSNVKPDKDEAIDWEGYFIASDSAKRKISKEDKVGIIVGRLNLNKGTLEIEINFYHAV